MLTLDMPDAAHDDQSNRADLRKECYLHEKRGMGSRFDEDMPEAMLLVKMQKFMDLQVQLMADFRKEVCAGLTEIKCMLRKKKNFEEHWFIRAAYGMHCKHESGYYHEIGHEDVEGRFAKVAIMNKKRRRNLGVQKQVWYQCCSGVRV